MEIKFSKSKLNSYIQCPEKYRLHYELELRPRKTPVQLVEGSAIHHIVESGLIYRNINQDIPDIASERFWEDAPLESAEYASSEEYQKAQELCLSQAKSFLEQLQDVQALEAEYYVQTPLVHPISGYVHEDISLHGYIDLVANFGGRRGILDLKTVSKSPSKGIGTMSPELGIYSYLLRSLDGSFEELTDAGYIYLVRKKEPAVIRERVLRTTSDYLEVYRLCLQVAESIRRMHFWKNPGLHCSWCEYQPLCTGDRDTAQEKFGEESLDFYQLVSESMEDSLANASCNYDEVFNSSCEMAFPREQAC